MLNHISSFLPPINDYANQRESLNTSLKLDFSIPSPLHAELKEYKLVYWSASFLYQKIKICLDSENYCIERSDTQYQTSLINCSIEDLYKIARTEPDRQIRISFRQAREHWNLSAFCIIKLPAEFKGGCKPLRYCSSLQD